MHALNDLAGDRHLGFGVVGNVPFQALQAWARVHGLDREAFVILRDVIKRLDRDRCDRAESERIRNGGKS